MDLHLYSIMMPDTDHLEEICQDIKRQVETGVASCPLFEMTLVPEGTPPVDKAGEMCARFGKFQKRLKELGMPSGVLVQASIGHGWVLSEMFPYQPYVSLDQGKEYTIVCPYDRGFRSYIKNVFSTIAAQHPDTIMLDDDFRLMFARDGGACGCPLHVAAFNKQAGTDFTRQQIWEAVHLPGSEGDRYNEILLKTQQEALLDCAREMRKGIDEVDPTIPGSFCCVGNNAENGAEIAKIMAGNGNPVVVRINNGNYTPAGARFFSDVFLRAAQPIAKLRDQVDVILAETDTCPQNRYSTGAMSLHTHFTGTLLEGAQGAKHWITRLSSYEPQSGEYYRTILARYAGFYRKIADLVPRLAWQGLRIPVSAKPCFDFRRDISGMSAWSSCVLERLGLPIYFSARQGGITCLEGEGDLQFTDEELLQLLSGPMFLASDTAKHLIERGFGEYLGVDVLPWNGAQPSYEYLPEQHNRVKYQQKIMQLVPTDAATQELSAVYHSVSEASREYLFPGVTCYHNKLGGKIFVFSGTPKSVYNLIEAFSFLTWSRKQQLVAMVKAAGRMPVYYPGDAEMYLRSADVTDEAGKPTGTLFCAAFNIGLDPIEQLTLVAEKPVTEITRIASDGSEQPVSFTQKDGVLYLDMPCLTLTPEMLLLR